MEEILRRKLKSLFPKKERYSEFQPQNSIAEKYNIAKYIAKSVNTIQASVKTKKLRSYHLKKKARSSTQSQMMQKQIKKIYINWGIFGLFLGFFLSFLF